MHYVERMKNDLSDYAQTVADCNSELDDLIGYLISPKFANDPTVQVNDILMRVREIKHNLIVKAP